MGSMLASYAEAMSLAEAAGLNGKDFVEVINTGAMAAPIFALKVLSPFSTLHRCSTAGCSIPGMQGRLPADGRLLMGLHAVSMWLPCCAAPAPGM